MEPLYGNPSAPWGLFFEVPQDTVDNLAAATVNVGFTALANQCQWLRVSSDVVAAINFQPMETWAGPTLGLYCAVWNYNSVLSDITSLQWLIGTYYSAPPAPAVIRVQYGTGGGDDTWYEYGGDISSPNPPTMLAVDLNDFKWVTMADSGGGSLYAWLPPGGGTWTLVNTVGVTTDFRVCASPPGTYTTGHGKVAYAAGTTGSAGLGYITDSGGLVSTSGPTIGETWILKTNGVIVLGVAQIPNPTAFTSTNPTSWTATSLGSVGSNIPSDIAWNPVLSLWLMAAQVPGGYITFYTSPDGINWTNTGTTLESLVNDNPILSCIGEIWLMTVGGGGQDFAYLYYSIDGANWYLTSAALYQTSIPGSAIVSGQTSSLFFNPGGGAGGVYRFSYAQRGVTPVL